MTELLHLQLFWLREIILDKRFRVGFLDQTTVSSLKTAHKQTAHSQNSFPKHNNSYVAIKNGCNDKGDNASSNYGNCVVSAVVYVFLKLLGPGPVAPDILQRLENLHMPL